MNVSKSSKLIRAWRNELQGWCDEHGASLQESDDQGRDTGEATIEMPLVSESVAGVRALLDGLRADECRSSARVAHMTSPATSGRSWWGRAERS